MGYYLNFIIFDLMSGDRPTFKESFLFIRQVTLLGIYYDFSILLQTGLSLHSEF